MRQSRPVRRLFLILLSVVVLSPLGVEVTRTQQRRKPFVPVTDAMLQNPAPGDWLMWRRTLNSWGYSPLDQINRDNVGDLTDDLDARSAPGQPTGHAARLWRRAVHAQSEGHHPGNRRATGDLSGSISATCRTTSGTTSAVIWPRTTVTSRSMATTSSTPASTTTSSRSTPRPGKTCGRRWSSITRPIRRSRGRARSSPTAR